MFNRTVGLYVTATDEMSSGTPGLDCLNDGIMLDTYKRNSKDKVEKGFLNRTAGLYVTAGDEMSSRTPGYDCLSVGIMLDMYEPSPHLHTLMKYRTYRVESY